MLKIQRFLGTTGSDAIAAGRWASFFNISISLPAQAPEIEGKKNAAFENQKSCGCAVLLNDK